MYIVIWASGPYVYSYLGGVVHMYTVIWASSRVTPVSRYSYLG